MGTETAAPPPHPNPLPPRPSDAGESEQEEAQRARVVAVARSWIGTPYHHMARIKGVGVDCAQILVAVYAEAGLIDEFDIPFYSPQWNQHHDEERYLAIVARHGHEIAGPPGAGDVVVWKFGRTFSHGAIVVDWPHVIHAPLRAGPLPSVCLEDAQAAQWLAFVGETRIDFGKPRPRKFFSFWAQAT